MFDPWLEHRLRLADRRGLLARADPSRVQAAGLELLMVAEARDSAGTQSDAFKLAIVSADPAKFIPIVFPEWLVKKDDEITEGDLQDEGGAVWKFDPIEMTQEEVEAELAKVLADPAISLTAADLYGSEPIPMPDFTDDETPPEAPDCTE